MVTTIPAPHTLDQQPAHFRVTSFTKTPAPFGQPGGSDEFTLHLEYPRIGRKEGVGVSRLHLTETRLNAVRDATESQDIYWADLTVPPFPGNLSYDFLDRLLSAIEERQVVDASSEAS